MTEILLAHTHSGYRSKVISTLQRDNQAVTEIEPSFGAVVYHAEKHGAQLLLINEELLSDHNYENVATIRRRFPDLRIICLSTQNDPRSVSRLIYDYGIKALMGCDATSGEIYLAIQAAHLGAMIVSSDISLIVGELKPTEAPPTTVGDDKFPQPSATPDSNDDYDDDLTIPALTDREIEVLHLIARGLRSKQIAPLLNISTRTVETHRANIRKKINGRGLNVMIALSNRILESQRTERNLTSTNGAQFLMQ